jgi:hypothetical protein
LVVTVPFEADNVSVASPTAKVGKVTGGVTGGVTTGAAATFRVRYRVAVAEVESVTITLKV